MSKKKNIKDLTWDELIPGASLFSFEKNIDFNPSEVLPEDRPYADSNSFVEQVGDWRIEKPIFKEEYCIHCQFCWIYCPDMSIISRDQKFSHIDYEHCKGCGICVEVCPTNPKSLLMFAEHTDDEKALEDWPKKDEKEK
jgi:pyruvate ferredoxin oxidoreductase delta subunit